MTENEIKEYLKINYGRENESVEWKPFQNLKHSVSANAGADIISYVSAISNMEGGHLIIGVEDKTLEIIGLKDMHNYNPENFKYKLTQDCSFLPTEGLLIEEYITSDSNKRIWVIHIPKHSLRTPVIAHKKAWHRIGDSIEPINSIRLEKIKDEVNIINDWSKVIIENATIDDLDIDAIAKAKIEFIKRNPKYSEELKSWTNVVFLDKAKITIKGKITRTALILLGKEESEHYLNSTVKIRWNLKSIDNRDKDFEIFSIPLVLNIDKIYNKIRNLKYRYLRQGTLFPDEVLRYDSFTIREPLLNAIAHQDYSKGGRINLVEFEDDHLVFSNLGTFLPKSVEDVVLSDVPQEVYRNPFLVEAMKNLDLIETQGGGIKKVFNYQLERFFPLPIFSFEDGRVKVKIIGKILDENFAEILIRNKNLSFEDIFMLDKIQKKEFDLSIEAIKYLKSKKLIEGKKDSYYISHNVVQKVSDDHLQYDYINNKSFDDHYFKNLIYEFLVKFPNSNRKKIAGLIVPKLSTTLNPIQKNDKLTNLLSDLRRQGKISCSKPSFLWNALDTKINENA